MADQVFNTDNITNQAQRQKKQQSPLVNEIAYDGLTSQVYKIWLLNFFMQIITLGIYSFWGKTRLRKYVVGSFSLVNDWFEYTGTGKELFIGFLKSIPVLLGIYAPFLIATFIAPEAAWPVVLLLPIFYVIPVALYSALRYRISRLQWRGIHYRLDGSALKYANLFLWRGFLNIVSIGILLPFSDIKKYQYKVNHSYYGDIPFSFKGSGKNLMGIHLATYAIAIGLIFFMLLGIQLITASFPVAEISMAAQGMSNENILQLIFGKPAVITAFALIFTPFLILPIVRLVYKTALIHEMINNLHASSISFKSTVTTIGLCKLKVGNFLILISTLGLGIPYIMQRNLRFLAAHTMVKGDLDTSQIKQVANQKPADAEGLQEVMNLDSGLI